MEVDDVWVSHFFENVDFLRKLVEFALCGLHAMWG